MLALECHLVQNVIDSQKHLACIRQWEKRPFSLPPLGLHNVTSQLESHESHVATPEADETLCNTTLEDESHDRNVTATSELNDSYPAPLEAHPGANQPPLRLHVHGTTSPDSGAESSGVPPLEPLDISSMREELATLVADKQRMEAQHKRLQRRLKEVKDKEGIIQQVRIAGILPSLDI